MRVLLLHDYARLAGGAEIETEHLRRGLASRGVEVRLFASRARIAGEPIEAEHTCMSLRGARAHGSRTVTSSLLGQLRDNPATRAEFLALTRGERR